MTAATQTLADFLLACVADDEAKAREAAARASEEFSYAMHSGEPTLEIYEDRDYSAVGLIIDPARVLAECESKRSIVADMGATAAIEGGGYENAHSQMLRILALPYADHPDYHEEWKP